MLACGTFDLPVMSLLSLLALSANGERDWPFGPLFQMRSFSLIIESLDPGREEVGGLCCFLVQLRFGGLVCDLCRCWALFESVSVLGALTERVSLVGLDLAGCWKLGF